MNLRTFDLPHLSTRAALMASLAVGVSGCEDDKPKLPGDSIVLAKVNDAPVTRYDLERALDKSLGKFATESVERGARKQVLESLIQSKAMAALGEKALTPEQKLVLDREVESYRESLLVKHYLSQKSPPKPITSRQIKNYYEEHPERFGATTERRYELLFGKKQATGATRVAVMRALSAAPKQEDWKSLADESSESAPLGYTTGLLSEKALHPKLKQLLEGTKTGASSNVAFVQGRAYIGRISGDEKKPPRPLAEVRDEIEKVLGPVNVREAIRAVGKSATAEAKIERFDVDLTKPLESEKGKGDED